VATPHNACQIKSFCIAQIQVEKKEKPDVGGRAKENSTAFSGKPQALLIKILKNFFMAAPAVSVSWKYIYI